MIHFYFSEMSNRRNYFFNVNNMHNSIKFTFEGEADNTLSFLDVNVRSTADQFVTSVFRKQTFSGLSTNYFSSIYFKYKAACLVTLFFRAFRISSTYEIFHVEVEKLRTLFTNNLYPSIPEPRKRVVVVRVPRTLSVFSYISKNIGKIEKSS